MELSFRTEEHKKVEKKKIADFCERYGSTLVRATPEEIILKWLEFQYARYQVHENEEGFYINDLEDKELVAFITKKDPRAFSHAYELCEKLNDPPEAPFLSIDGRELTVMDINPLVELKDNSIVDFLINSMENEKNE